MKLAANLMLSHMLSGLAGAVSLAVSSHLKPLDLVDILEAGLGSPYFRVKGAQMASGSFHPQFTLDLVRKDLRLIRAALDAAGLPFPTIGPILGMFDEAARRGWGAEDGAAVIKLFSRPEDPDPASSPR
jgi:3-hydroxyisobutyrate dehydrogenase-like beta-hydroxyacid dehydrogenase